MNVKKLITATEVILCAGLFVFTGYGMYLGRQGQEAFDPFVQEDGLVENLTALFLFGASMVSLYRVFEYRKMKKLLWVFSAAFLAFLFFFAAGEEISWGQRIFNIESSEFFLENNKQAETNLHNLVVGGKNLNKLIFSQLMFIILIIYFVFSRLIVWKIPVIRNLVNKFRVPLPKTQHIVVMLIVTLMILSIGLVKESELHELSFAFVFFLIFLNPAKTDQV
ncbi:hypothetical protein [Gaoshiqia sp. Z1-71]|uniref:hypothetical protein n=1 Tax=Gaoshiqia hydrogeniformans TaxID=3290090 RepID=UPI003BF7841E